MNLLHRISSSIGRHFNIWLPLSLATATLIALLGPYSKLTTQFGDAILFDTNPASSTAGVTSRISILGPSGIALYHQGLLLDALFALSNAILLTLLLLPATFPKARPFLGYLLLLPVLFLTTDLLENLCIAVNLSSSVSTTFVTLGQAATTMKSICFLFAATAGLLLWLHHAFYRTIWTRGKNVAIEPQQERSRG